MYMSRSRLSLLSIPYFVSYNLPKSLWSEGILIRELRILWWKPCGVPASGVSFPLDLLQFWSWSYVYFIVLQQYSYLFNIKLFKRKFFQIYLRLDSITYLWFYDVLSLVANTSCEDFSIKSNQFAVCERNHRGGRVKPFICAVKGLPLCI